MRVHIPDPVSLTPRWLDREGQTLHRVVGKLDMTSAESTCATYRLVAEVIYDGATCQYRLLDQQDPGTCKTLANRTRVQASLAANEATDEPDSRATNETASRAAGQSASPGPAATTECVSENDSQTYRSFAQIVVECLRTFRRNGTLQLHRFPDAPPSRALSRRWVRLGSGPEAVTLTVLDTCITNNERLWSLVIIQLDDQTRECREPSSETLQGWILLSEQTTRNSVCPIKKKGLAHGLGETVGLSSNPDSNPRRPATRHILQANHSPAA